LKAREKADSSEKPNRKLISLRDLVGSVTYCRSSQ
jgi:hypothetical protein